MRHDCRVCGKQYDTKHFHRCPYCLTSPGRWMEYVLMGLMVAVSIGCLVVYGLYLR